MNFDLYTEQQRAHDRLVKSRGGMLFWRVGTGKTRTALSIFATLQQELKWALPCVCLVVCRRQAFDDWRKEIRNVGLDWMIYENSMLGGTPVEFLINPCFLFLSEGMLAKEVATLQNDRRIKMVLLDEGFLYKNPKSAKGKAANKVTKLKKSVLLSGSIMTAKDLRDIYGIATAVNKHRALASSRTKFTEEFLHTDVSSPFPSFYPKPGSYKAVMDKLSFCTDVYYPPDNERKITEEVITVQPTVQQRRAFKELKDSYGSKELNLQFDSALTLMLKAQQIANGWVEDQDGNIRVFDSAKIIACCDKIEELVNAGEHCIVWCAFRYDIEVLSKELNKRKIATLQMKGGEKFDHETWLDENKNIRCTLATEASGSSVNHFKDTPYALYFSTNFKWLDLQQSMGRTNRGRGSIHAECFYYFFQVEKSLDAYILHAARTSGAKEKTVLKFGEVTDWLKGW